MKQSVFVSEECAPALRERLAGMGGLPVLLVTGGKSYKLSGAKEILDPLLADNEIWEVSGLAPNPDTTQLAERLNALPEDEPGAILAVGGGSVIDYAKLFKEFWHRRAELDDWSHKSSITAPASIRLYAVPTTAGSGSEATHFAVVYHRGEKFSIADPRLLPEASFLLPELIRSSTRKQVATSAMDALCQGIESYWSIYSTDSSRELARQAIEILVDCFRTGVSQGDQRHFEALLRGANLAGQAINITKTTAPHAVSYALTSLFGIPHGHAVGLVLPEFYNFNRGVGLEDCLDPRGRDFVLARLQELSLILGAGHPEHVAATLKDLASRGGLETRLSEVGIHTQDDLLRIAENGFNPERVNNNPRRVEKQSLLEVLERTL